MTADISDLISHRDARMPTWEQAEEAHEEAVREARTSHVKVIK